MTEKQLIVDCEIDLEIIIEYIGIGFNSRVNGNNIRNEKSEFNFQRNEKSISITCNMASRAELLLITKLLATLGAKCNSAIKPFSEPEFEIEFAKGSSSPELNATINKDSHLTLADLKEIHDLLTDQKTPIANLRRDEKFNFVFPHVDSYAGYYGPLRHRSGHEIFVEWTENQFPENHKIDAPAPTKPANYLPRDPRESTAQTTGPYRNSPHNRWQLANILGTVPQEHKSGVFAWVADIFHDYDYFHDTRGGIMLPEIFEIKFDKYKLTATHNFEFELSSASF